MVSKFSYKSSFSDWSSRPISLTVGLKKKFLTKSIFIKSSISILKSELFSFIYHLTLSPLGYIILEWPMLFYQYNASIIFEINDKMMHAIGLKKELLTYKQRSRYCCELWFNGWWLCQPRFTFDLPFKEFQKNRKCK